MVDSIKPQSPKSVVAAEVVVGEEGKYYHDLSPDSLFKRIEDLDWLGAVYSLKSFPDEASEWIIKRDKNNDELFKRLPIHEACIRRPSIDIISGLLDSCPSSVIEQDSHGRTALHHACIHGASEEIIYLLLDAGPDAMYAKDFCGDTVKNSYEEDSRIGIMIAMSKEEISEKVNEIKNEPIFSNTKAAEATYSVHAESIQTLREEVSQAATAYAEREVLYQETKDLKSQISDLHQYINECEVKHKETTTELAVVSGRNSSMKWSFNRLEIENKGLKSIYEEKDKLIATLRKYTKEGSTDLQQQLDLFKKDSEIMKTKLQLENEKMKDGLLTLSSKLRMVSAVVTQKETEIEKNKESHEKQIAKYKRVMEKAADDFSSAQESGKVADELKNTAHQEELEELKLELLESNNRELHLQKKMEKLRKNEIKTANILDALNEEKKNDKNRIGALEGVVRGFQERIYDLEDELETVSTKYLDVSQKLVEKSHSVGELKNRVDAMSKGKEQIRLDLEKLGMKSIINEVLDDDYEDRKNYSRITDAVPSETHNGYNTTKENLLFDTVKSGFRDNVITDVASDREKESFVQTPKENLFSFDTVKSGFQDHVIGVSTSYDTGKSINEAEVFSDEASKLEKHQELLENAISLLRSNN